MMTYQWSNTGCRSAMLLLVVLLLLSWLSSGCRHDKKKKKKFPHVQKKKREVVLKLRYTWSRVVAVSPKQLTSRRAKPSAVSVTSAITWFICIRQFTTQFRILLSHCQICWIPNHFFFCCYDAFFFLSFSRLTILR